MQASLQNPISPVRQAAALIAGIVSVLSAVGMFLFFIIIEFGFSRICPDAPVIFGGFLLFEVIAVTFPIALISTLVALFLVGPDRSRLAWISFGAYFVLFFAAIILSIFVHRIHPL